MLRRFIERHPDAAAAVKSWYRTIKRGSFATPHDVRAAFPQASFLGGGITVFNIGSHRIVTHIVYEWDTVYLRAIMTHAEYDREKWKYQRRKE